MTRQQRRAINRTNAQSSTGPITEAGKATSSANSTKHGLTSMKPYLPAEEQDYLAFAADQLRRFDPQNPTEQGLASTIVDVEWRLKRIPGMEARLFADEESDPHKTIRSLDTLSRHEVRLRKLLMNTVMELHTIVSMRRKHQAAQGLQAEQKANGFVLQSAVTNPKQTQPAARSAASAMAPSTPASAPNAGGARNESM